MAAGDRNSKGKPKDIVRHFWKNEGIVTYCGRRYIGYATTDITDVTCLRCLDLSLSNNSTPR